MENVCNDCKHFRKHYIKRGKKYYEIKQGHCVYPRIKMRDADTKACGYFQVKQEKAGTETPE